MAWPAFAYSIEDDAEAKRTYAYVLTYLVVVASWLALALGLLAPWLVRILATPAYYEGHRVVAPLAFGGMAYAAYIVMAIGVGRAKRTQFNWAITGLAAIVNVALNLILIPPYGMMGAAAATVAAYGVMFAAMTWYAQRVFPVPYQWRRVLTAIAAAVALLLAGKAVGGLAAAIGLVLAYPLALLALGFFLPEERRRLFAR
jgi:O-antigen/teichoic acid export membrane protein